MEEKIGTKITLRSVITPWLIRHAGYLITRPNGRTALQMLKGQRSNGQLAEFGELEHFLIPKTKDMLGKIEDRWSEGIWLGCDVRSGKHLIGMTDGVFRVSTVRSKTSDTRWSPDRVASFGALLPSMYQDKATADHPHSPESMAKLPRPMLSTHHKMLSQSPFAHGKYTRAI